MKSFPKQIKILLAIFAVVVLVWAEQASAAGILDYIGHIGLNALLDGVDGIAYLVGYVAGLFVTIGGTLVNWTLNLNSQLLTNPTVRTGWVVSRDLANLGFVLAIILISFATILRISNYQMQNTLLRLISAALLVNFSLVLAGVFLDFAGILTNFFIDKATGGYTIQAGGNVYKVGEGLANAFHIQSVLQQTEEESKIKGLIQGLKDDPNKHYPFTASVLFVAIFTVIVAMSLISLAAMLYIRYIWLTILLILAPLAWLMWIWPDLEHLWKKWWGKFMQWTMFGPAVTFFIYLALAVAAQADKGGLTPVGSGLDASIGITFKDFGAMLARMISVLGILYGGLYTANAIGIAGAGVGFSVAKGVKNMMVSGAVVGGGIAGGLAGRTAGLLYQKASGGKTFTEDLRNITARGSGIPFVGGAMQAANRALVTGASERMEKYQKGYETMDTDARLAALKDRTLLDKEKQAALINAIAEKNELGRVKDLVKRGVISQGRFEDFAKASVQRGGAGAKTLISKDPLLAGYKFGTRQEYLGTGGTNAEYDEEIIKAFKFMKPEAILDLDLGALKENPAFLAQFKGAHLAKMTERAPVDQDQFVEILKENIEKLKIVAEKARQIEAKDRTREQEEAITNFSKLSGLAKHVMESPAWRSSNTSALAGVAAAALAPAAQEPKKPSTPGESVEHLAKIKEQSQ